MLGRGLSNLSTTWTRLNSCWKCGWATLSTPKRNWFSMYKGQGHKARCPGQPTIAHGFQTKLRWFLCFGEVFKIYARGKPNGTPITDHDDIMLYYIHAKKWAGFFDPPDFRTCPGTNRPPPPNRYDVCWGEVAELWLR